jgi:hypothetical protein
MRHVHPMDRPTSAWTAASLLLCLGTACGGDQTGPGAGGVTQETAARASKVIGPDGGTLTATSGTGARYTLTIPEGALRDTVTVSLTPVTALAALPASAPLVAAAQFAPEGLKLARTATLRVSALAAHDRTRLVGLTYSGQGGGLTRAVAGASEHGDGLVVLVTHFSGAAVASAQDAGTLTGTLTTPASVQAFIALQNLSSAQQASGIFDAAALAAVLTGWYTSVIEPALVAASSDQQTVDAVALYDSWQLVLQCGGDSCLDGSGAGMHLWPDNLYSPIAAALSATLGDAQASLGTALKTAVARSRQQCIAHHDLVAALNVLWWDALAIVNHVDTPANGLDPESILGNFCVQVAITQASFPSSVQANTPAQLQLRAGLSFGGGPAVFTPALDVSITPTGTVQTGGAFSTAAGTGLLTTSFTPTGNEPVFLDVRAALTQLGLNQKANVVRDTLLAGFLNIGVSITPFAAILDAGAQATFTATVSGIAQGGVTWSATGGAVSGTGNTVTYTAGHTTGTFAITATSVGDPAKKATARIDVLGVAAPVTVTVTPYSVLLAPGQTKQFTATVTGTSDQRVTWTAAAGGSITPSGLFTAGPGASGGSVASAAIATSVADRSVSGAGGITISSETFPIAATYVGTATFTSGARTGQTLPIAFLFSDYSVESGQLQRMLICSTPTWHLPLETASVFSNACASLGAPFARADGNPNTVSWLINLLISNDGGVTSAGSSGQCHPNGSPPLIEGRTLGSGTWSSYVKGTRFSGTGYCAVAGTNQGETFTFTADGR